MDETNLTENGSNLYKFYMAHCINEIVCRYRGNQDKRKTIYSLKDSLVPLNAEPVTSGQYHNQNQYAFQISIEELCERLIEKFGEYEAGRIKEFFEKNNI